MWMEPFVTTNAMFATLLLGYTFIAYVMGYVMALDRENRAAERNARRSRRRMRRNLRRMDRA
jgi:sensor domain CHASE-containing protein